MFTDKITSIKATGNRDLNIYHEIAGLLYSSLFSYFILIKSSTVGIMIEQQVNDKEKFNFPYLNNSSIAKCVEKIEAISKKLFQEKQNVLNPKVQPLQDEKKKLIANLNDEILNSFDLDKQERVLVDYAVNITIPLIMKHKGYEKKLFSPIPFNSSFLEEYINLFLSRFETSFREKHLEAKIWHSDYIIGIFFRVVPNNSTNEQLIEWQEKNNNELLKQISLLGTEKITEKLFIQKDIRGFEKEGFYIIKPNEKKLWHKAIGYLDVNDFIDAILKTGKEAYNG